MRSATLSVLSAALLASVVSTGARALDEGDFNFRTTASLAHICGTEGEGVGAVEAKLACRAFIAAAVQYHDEVTDRKKLKPLICYPKSATLEDGRQAFVAWAAKNEGNAERMGELPVIGLVRALASAYPCK
jgi:hypothetical protein